MKNLLLITVFLSLAACKTTGTSPEQQKKLDAKASYASKKFFDCGVNVVSKFDDGISPAHVVGRAMGKYCGDYALAYTNAQYEADGGDFDKEYFYELITEKTFTDFVLFHRAEKKKDGQ